MILFNYTEKLLKSYLKAKQNKWIKLNANWKYDWNWKRQSKIEGQGHRALIIEELKSKSIAKPSFGLKNRLPMCSKKG